MGGIGRTGTVVGCYLNRAIHHDEITKMSHGDIAFLELQRLWQACPKSAMHYSPETHEQARYIVNWKGK